MRKFFSKIKSFFANLFKSAEEKSSNKEFLEAYRDFKERERIEREKNPSPFVNIFDIFGDSPRGNTSNSFTKASDAFLLPPPDPTPSGGESNLVFTGITGRLEPMFTRAEVAKFARTQKSTFKVYPKLMGKFVKFTKDHPDSIDHFLNLTHEFNIKSMSLPARDIAKKVGLLCLRTNRDIVPLVARFFEYKYNLGYFKFKPLNGDQ